MKIGVKKPVEVEAKTLHLYLKVRDMFDARITDQHGEQLIDYSGYVPDFMPGEHYGDYVILDIDIDTGQITNWSVPTREQMEEFLSAGEADD